MVRSGYKISKQQQKIRTHAFTFLLFGLSTCSNGLVRDYYSRSRFRTPRYKTPLFHVHFCVDNTVECRIGISTLSGLMPRARKKADRERYFRRKRKKNLQKKRKKRKASEVLKSQRRPHARGVSDERETRERRERDVRRDDDYRDEARRDEYERVRAWSARSGCPGA